MFGSLASFLDPTNSGILVPSNSEEIQNRAGNNEFVRSWGGGQNESGREAILSG